MIKNIDPMLVLRETDRRIAEYLAELSTEELGRNYNFRYLELIYNLRYDTDTGKFLVNQLELIYNIDYSGEFGESKPVWIIR